MITHELISNTPEWDAHRLNHDNASEVAAVLGLSKTMTRTELMHMKHTGLGKEFSNWVRKNILDHGHEVEAMARPIVEEIIGENLYPVTCTLGRLGASLDGLTMDELLAFEHKQWNAELAALVADGVVPDYHMPQCQQILLITKAEKLYFVVSDGTRENMVYTVVLPDPAWFERIEAGWKQFHEDLANYVAPEVVTPVVAQPVAGLPVVFDMHVEGKLVSCNIEQYKPAALAYIGAINTKLETDQHFADADLNAKFCRDSAKKLSLAIEQALGQMGDINTAIQSVKEIAAAFDAKGLLLEKLVKSEKEARRDKIVADAVTEFSAHYKQLNDRLGRVAMPAIQVGFSTVVKGLKSIDSMRDKVSTELARVKIEANAVADKIDANLRYLDQVNAPMFLFSDLQTVCLKAPDDFQMLVKSRVSDHAAKEAARIEAERARIRQEEIDRLAREQAEHAHAVRVEAERIQREQIVQAQAARIREEQTVVVDAEVPKDSVIVATGPRVIIPLKTGTPPTMTLGEISTRLSFNVSSTFLAALGFEATTVRAAKMYHADDFKAICEAIKAHIGEVQDAFEAATA